MTRKLTAHAINPCNEALLVRAIDGPGPGGASHHYEIAVESVDDPERDGNPGQPRVLCTLRFQNGAVKAEGFRCSNPKCGVIHHQDPRGPCPACQRADEGWSCYAATIGVNGITHEALIGILLDRLEAFQAGPYANPYNEAAVMHLRSALEALHSRTRARMQRGVEGTMQV